MLAFVDYINSCITNKGGVPNSCFEGEPCIKGRKIWEKCICSGRACIHAIGSSFLPHLEEPTIFGAFYLGCVEPLPLA
jgi:hypothetical protein